MNVLLAVVTAGAGFCAFVGVVFVCAVRRRRRAAFLPVLLCLSLVAPVCGIAAASQSLAGTMAQAGAGVGAALLLTRCRLSLGLLLLGDAIGVATLLIGALLVWIDPPPKPSTRPPAPARRSLLLVAFSVLAVAAVAAQHEYARTTNGLVVAAVRYPAAPGPAPQEALAALTSRISTGILLGTLGTPPLLLLLAGLGFASAIAAWKVEAPAGWRRTAPFVLLLLALALAWGAVCAGRPVRLPEDASPPVAV